MYYRRILFPRGEQKTFIQRAQAELNASAKDLALLVGMHSRTLRDWRREKFSMSEHAVTKLCKEMNIPFPKNATLQEPFWYAAKGAAKGGRAVIEKYGQIGNPVYRKQKWHEWWEREGKNIKRSYIARRHPFRSPPRSKRLAEFIGIMIGDGNITRWQISITLHHIDDLPYSKFVTQLIENLFRVSPSIYHRPQVSTNDLTISRTGLVEYLTRQGLPIGNKVKQNIDIPSWIMEDKKFWAACCRGLIDTDGSVFTHRYKVNDKWYRYKKLAFTSASPPLRESMFKILDGFDLRPRKAGLDVRLDGQRQLREYFRIIGSHNPKHLKRYKK